MRAEVIDCRVGCAIEKNRHQSARDFKCAPLADGNVTHSRYGRESNLLTVQVVGRHARIMYHSPHGL